MKSGAVRLLAQRIGLRHALAHRMRAGLTVAGIAAGVALVFSIQILNTALSDAVTGVNHTLAGEGRVLVTASSSAGLDDAAVARVRGTSGVDAVAPLLLARTRLAAAGRDRAALVVGATPDLLAFRDGGDEPRLTGDFGDGSGVVVSAELARALGLRVGSVVRIGGADRTVTGTLAGAGVERLNDGLFATMALPAAQDLFVRGGRVDAMVVKVADPAATAALRSRLEHALAGIALVDTSVDEQASMQNVRPFAGLSTLIGLVSLLVAAIVVLNTTSVAVAERRRELSLARLLGATPRELRRAVLMEAAVLGALGSAAGLLLGWAVARGLVARAGTDYEVLVGGAAVGQAVVQASAVGFALFTGVIAAVLGAFFPARRALKVAPAEAVRPDAPQEWTPAAAERRPRRLALVGLALLAVAVAAGASSPSDADAAARAQGLAIVALLAGALLVLPMAVSAAVRRLPGALARLAGPLGRLAGGELRQSARRVTTEVGMLMMALTLVLGLAGTVGALASRFKTLSRDYVSAPVYVEAASTVGYLATQPLDPATVERIRAVPGVTAALPGQTAYVTVDGRPAVLYANPMSDAQRAGVLDQLADARMADDGPAFVNGLLRGEIAMSHRTANTLGLHVGDAVTLPTPTGARTYRVAAAYDDIAAIPTFIIDRAAYAEAWGDSGAQRVQVMTAPGQEGAVLSRLKAMAGPTVSSFRVFTRDAAVAKNSRDLLRQFNTANTLQWGALIVAALCMAVTFFTSIVQRRWEHAVQRVLGMSRRQLNRVLLLQASATAALAWVGAVVVGLWLSRLLSKAAEAGLGTTLPTRLPAGTAAVCLVAVLLAAAAATLYPRRVAARTAPVEVLRGE